MKQRYRYVGLTIIVYLVLFGCALSTKGDSERTPSPDLLSEIIGIVEKNFYNPQKIETDFPALKLACNKKLQGISGQHEFSNAVNAMLKGLNASHTYYLCPQDYEYYHLASIFSSLPEIQEVFKQKEMQYPTVGIITETIDLKVFIASVLPGGPADQAGLLQGDEIISVNGAPYSPVESFEAHIGVELPFIIRRTEYSDLRTVLVTPKMIHPRTEMLDAEQASIRVIEREGKRIGYIHIYSYAGEEYHQVLLDTVSWGAIKDADSLIIDLRYGLGGANPDYLNMFNRKVPVIVSTDNTGKTSTYDPQWRKPTVYLVNKTTRSGKEILAFGAKKYHLAAVVGERTAGAVLGARLFPLSNGDLLYLAVRHSTFDGEDIEGSGVPPDVEVPMDIRYSSGNDIQLEKSIEYLLMRN